MMYGVREKQTGSILTRDRVRLDADIYYPDGEGPFPVLLMRQPYGRAIASTVVYAHPIWYASHGYIVVVQDVRGRGTSEGEFKLFESEIEDGYDAVNWAASLPGSSGDVGMYGFSYQGMTQLYAAVKHPTALKAICPAMLGYDLYDDWAYEGGAFCLQANLGWAIQISAETARLKGDEATFLALSQAAKNLPLGDRIPARPEILRGRDSFYEEWLDRCELPARGRPAGDPYWQRLSPKTYVEAFDLPMLHIGGWFDPYLRGTLNLYKAMESSDRPQHLIVGPWAHLPWGRRVGALDYGAAAVSGCDRLQIRWFDQFLKGIDTGLLQDSPVQLFEMGRNEWKALSHYPTATPMPFFLTSTGLAGMDDRDGHLIAYPSSLSPAIDLLVHDPWRPVPALGGHAAAPSGSFDRAALDCRSDILTYTSDPLTEDLHLVGDVFAEFYCRADTPSFDLCAVLSEVKPNGSVYNFTQGYLRVEAAQELLQMTLQPTCIQIPQGSAIRLSLSGACFPAYPVNGGTGSLPGEARAIDAQIITIALRSGGDFPSKLRLPIQPHV
ncbi:CocE/NonD family hydrolase [Phormidesmis sp. 146-35]